MEKTAVTHYAPTKDYGSRAAIALCRNEHYSSDALTVANGDVYYHGAFIATLNPDGALRISVPNFKSGLLLEFYAEIFRVFGLPCGIAMRGSVYVFWDHNPVAVEPITPNAWITVAGPLTLLAFRPKQSLQ